MDTTYSAGVQNLLGLNQSNADVMMREMEMFDVMTNNRDVHIFSIATGKPQPLKDDNLPQDLSVRPNKIGPLENGAWPYLGGKEAIKKMTIHPKMKVNLYASEEMFPRPN